MAPPARDRRWIAPTLLLLALLLLAAAVGWMQTRGAFQRLWLPLAEQLVDGTFRADDGRLGFGGTLEIDGLRLDVPSLVRGEIASLRLKLRPWASVRRGVAVIDDLLVSGADLELPQEEPEGTESEDVPDAIEKLDPFEWPEIARARIDDSRIRIGSDDEAVTLGPITIRVDDLALPNRGALSLEAPLVQGPEGEAFRGRLSAVLTLSREEPEQEASQFEAKLEVSHDSHERSPIVLAVRGQGRTAGETTELQAFEIDLLAQGKVALSLHGSGSLLPAVLLDAHLVVDEIGVVESMLGAPQFAAAIEGDVHVEGDFDELVILPDLEVAGLRHEDDGLTPFSEPLRVGGQVTWQRGAGTLLLGPLEFGGASESGLGMLEAEGKLRPGQDSELEITAKAFDLLPWLRLASGVDEPPEVRGLVDGSISIRQTEDESSVEMGVAVMVVSPSGKDSESPARVPFRLKLQDREAPGEARRIEGTLTLRGPGVRDPLATAKFHWEREASTERAKLRVQADIPKFDVTPLATLWEGVGGDGPDSDAQAPPAPQQPAGTEPAAKDLVDLDVAIGEVRLRELVVRGGRVRAQLGGDRWEIRVEELGLSEGLVDLEAYGGPHGGGERVGWDLVVADVDVAPVLAAASPDGEAQLSGRLSVASRAEGVAAPGEDPFTAPQGSVSFDLSEGRASGLGVQQLLTQVAEIAQFAVIDYDEVEGEFPIEKGRVLIDELRLDGAAVHLVAAGEIGARDIDLVINPRLGPSLQALVPGDMLGSVVGTANQLLALPIVVVVKGPLSGFEIELQPAAPSVLQGSFSGLGELLTPEGPDPLPPSPSGQAGS